MGDNFAGWNSPHNELCSHFSLVPANVLLAEEKLAIQVGNVDSVEVNNMD